MFVRAARTRPWPAESDRGGEDEHSRNRAAALQRRGVGDSQGTAGERARQAPRRDPSHGPPSFSGGTAPQIECGGGDGGALPHSLIGGLFTFSFPAVAARAAS